MWGCVLLGVVCGCLVYVAEGSGLMLSRPVATLGLPTDCVRFDACFVVSSSPGLSDATVPCGRLHECRGPVPVSGHVCPPLGDEPLVGVGAMLQHDPSPDGSAFVGL